MRLKRSSAKWLPFCPGGDELTQDPVSSFGLSLHACHSIMQTRRPNDVVSNILDRSQRYFAHVTTVTLSWRVQNIVVMGRVYFTLECFEFSSNFEFDRNMLSGTGTRAASCPWLFIHASLLFLPQTLNYHWISGSHAWYPVTDSWWWMFMRKAPMMVAICVVKLYVWWISHTKGQ